MVQRLRSRADRIGSALDSLKRGAGRAATALNVRGPNVGDIGFEIDDVDLAMSSVSMRVLRRLDLDAIRARRIANYRRLADRMRGAVTPVFDHSSDGVCPLFFPVLVPNKHEAAAGAAGARRRRPRILERPRRSRRRRARRRRNLLPHARPRTARSSGSDVPSHRSRGTTGGEPGSQDARCCRFRIRGLTWREPPPARRMHDAAGGLRGAARASGTRSCATADPTASS